VNIAGRVFAQTGDKVGIGGFIVTGHGTKRVMARAIGPSMKVNGTPVPGRIQNPYLELHDSNGNPPIINDDWRSDQQDEIIQTGLAPTDNRESAIVKRLPAGNYTAFIRAADGTPGIGLVELYDLDTKDPGELGNLSVRADVGLDDNVLIDGLILQGGNAKRVLFRALGPSITTPPGTLQNPRMSLYNANGTLLRDNDDWGQAVNAKEIQDTGLAPSHTSESAILLSLFAGNYTCVVEGVGRTTGIAVAEAYKLDN
jgi:hypothetical protein